LIEICPDMAASIAEAGKPSLHVEMWERPRILLVDRDPDVGIFLSSRLRKFGVDTLIAHDAIHGFRIACREAPSVIITDYQLPNGDAHFLLWRLRNTAETDSIPVFVMSAARLGETTESSLKRDVCGRRGVERFFVKSFDTQELFTALQKFCAFMHDPSLPAAFPVLLQ
jgi:CheY-like chemotaxis protein